MPIYDFKKLKTFRGWVPMNFQEPKNCYRWFPHDLCAWNQKIFCHGIWNLRGWKLWSIRWVFLVWILLLTNIFCTPHTFGYSQQNNVIKQNLGGGRGANRLYLTIIPWAWLGSASIAHDAKGRMGYWLRGHEGERNNIVLVKIIHPKKYRDKTTLASKRRFSHHCFGFQSRHFSLLEGYNI